MLNGLASALDAVVVPEDDDGETVDLAERIAPYTDQKIETARTLVEFQARDGEALTFGDEQEIVSAAHGPRDKAIVQGLIATQEMYRRRMNSVMSGQRSGQAGNLIRAVSSRLVVVHDDPQAVLERPFAAEAFGLNPGTIYGLVDKWLKQVERLGLEDWGVQALHDRGDVGESGRSAYCWLPVRDKSDVAGSVLVLVHPTLAGYDPDTGFVPDQGTGYRARLSPAQDAAPRGSHPYRLENYGAHVQLVYQAFRRHAWPELAQATARLERISGWPAGVVEWAAHKDDSVAAARVGGAWWVLSRHGRCRASDNLAGMPPPVGLGCSDLLILQLYPTATDPAGLWPRF